jgi:hypothetical protein
LLIAVPLAAVKMTSNCLLDATILVIVGDVGAAFAISKFADALTDAKLESAARVAVTV